jgi:peptidoglycan/xylan/chitin deacetylase (PgdA/CDA1 family)
VIAALAALAVAGLGAWEAFAGSGSATTSPQANATLAPSGAASSGSAPFGSASSAGSPTASTSPASATGPTPHATLIALPHGLGHFDAAARPRMIRGPRHMAVPILMYHLIGTPPAGEPYPDLFVSQHDFATQMRYLEAHRFTAVTLAQVVAFWHGKGRLPAKPVVLSFDDGYRSDWRVAAPILQRIGWPGVLNLCMNAVRPHGDLPVPLVHALVRAGWEIDDHTLTHPDLTTLDAAGLHCEIVVSRARLQALTGERVSFFCYPSGAYDTAVIAVVRAAGFKGATTTNEGLATPGNRFTLARIRVHRAMDVATFAQALVR